jgi:hypothetical protein
LRPLIAPDERGTEHLIFLVEKNRTVHLAGKSDAAHFCVGNIREYRADC